MKLAFGIPLGIIIVFIIYMFIDMHIVELSSAECQSLIPNIEKYKQSSGSYPENTNEIVNGSSYKHCHYQNMEHNYIFVLTGSMFNLQAYVYSSDNKSWYWD